MSAIVNIEELGAKAGEVPAILLKAREESAQRLLMVYAITGLFFMLLPGTFLGVWNLISISGRHGAAISASWIQAHGHAQIFGWIGTFILGIGFYFDSQNDRPRGTTGNAGLGLLVALDFWRAAALGHRLLPFVLARGSASFSFAGALRFPYFPCLRQRPPSIRFEATIPTQAHLDDCSPGWDSRLWHRIDDESSDRPVRQRARHRPEFPARLKGGFLLCWPTPSLFQPSGASARAGCRCSWV